MAQAPEPDLRLQLLQELRRDHRDVRAGPGQPLSLARGDAPAANHHRRLGAESQENRQIIHGRCPWAQAGSAGERILGCRPHSRDSGCSHHQRPARRLSPGWVARVQGEQPMLG